MHYLKLFLAFILCWLIPGLGYFLVNKRVKAILLFVAIMSVVITGFILSDFRDVRIEENPYYYLGRFGGGLIWGGMWVFLHPTPRGLVPFQYFDIGHLYLCVAGTLNLIIALSVFTPPPSVSEHTTVSENPADTDPGTQPLEKPL